MLMKKKLFKHSHQNISFWQPSAAERTSVFYFTLFSMCTSCGVAGSGWSAWLRQVREGGLPHVRACHPGPVRQVHSHRYSSFATSANMSSLSFFLMVTNKAASCDIMSPLSFSLC
jgi:hypothetical protein